MCLFRHLINIYGRKGESLEWKPYKLPQSIKFSSEFLSETVNHIWLKVSLYLRDTACYFFPLTCEMCWFLNHLLSHPNNFNFLPRFLIFNIPTIYVCIYLPCYPSNHRTKRVWFFIINSEMSAYELFIPWDLGDFLFHLKILNWHSQGIR